MPFPTMPGISGVFTQDQMRRMPGYRDWINNVLAEMPEANRVANAYMSGIEGDQPSMHSWIQPKLETAINREMEPMTQGEEALARRDIRGNFNRMVGGMASRGAKMGSYSPTSVATAGAGRPAAALAAGYAKLHADKANLLRTGAAGAGQKLTSLYENPAQEYQAGRTARGELMQGLVSSGASRNFMAPVRRMFGGFGSRF